MKNSQGQYGEVEKCKAPKNLIYRMWVAERLIAWHCQQKIEAHCDQISTLFVQVCQTLNKPKTILPHLVTLLKPQTFHPEGKRDISN